MYLNEIQIKRITDTIKELINSGIDFLAETFLPVETENSKHKRKRKHRAKKKIRTDSKEV